MAIGADAGPTSTEPLSPELILVASPEEARAAREQLPDTSAQDWDDFLENIRARPEVDDAPLPEEVRPRRSRRIWLVAIAAVLSVAAAAWFGLSRRDGEPAASRPAGVQRPPVVAKPAAPTAKRPKPKPAAPAPKPRAARRARPASPRARPKPPPPVRAPKRVTSSTFVPARVFSWVAEQGAKGYVVRFFRNGRKVLQARTLSPRFVLPRGFALRPGRYRWTVVPRGVQRRQPLVDSRFVVASRRR